MNYIVVSAVTCLEEFSFRTLLPSEINIHTVVILFVLHWPEFHLRLIYLINGPLNQIHFLNYSILYSNIFKLVKHYNTPVLFNIFYKWTWITYNMLRC